MDQKILNLTDAVIQEIQNEPSYKQLLKAHKKIKEDPEIAALSEAFIKAKDAYFEAKKYGDYHPDLASYQRVFSEAKVALYRHPDVVAYKKAEADVQARLDVVSLRLAETVSPHVNAATTYGVLNKKGGSSCSSG